MSGFVHQGFDLISYETDLSKQSFISVIWMNSVKAVIL